MTLGASTAKWLERFDLWKESRLSQVEWCAVNGVNVKSFENARTRLKKSGLISCDRENRRNINASESLIASGFIKVDLSADPLEQSTEGCAEHNSTNSGVSIQVGKVKINLETNFDECVLMRLLELLVETHD